MSTQGRKYRREISETLYHFLWLKSPDEAIQNAQKSQYMRRGQKQEEVKIDDSEGGLRLEGELTSSFLA